MSENIFEEATCCVCNNQKKENFTILYNKADYSLVTCDNCGFTFVPPFFRKNISYENYKNEDVTKAFRSGNNWVKIERHKLRYNLIKKFKSKGSSLFDLGSGWGHFLLTGQMLGYDVYGIELAEQPYLYSKNDLKLPVEHINFFDMDESKKFDIITMWDVLEHIDKADDVIEKCARLANRDSLLVIQVPQIDSYFAKKHKEEWKMISLDHVNYFSKKTISQLLEKNGYKIETIKSSFEIKLFIMYTILPFVKRLKSKIKVSHAEANNQINAAERQQYFNTFTEKPMWKLKFYMKLHNMIYNTLSFFNIGEEMIVVAKKA